MLSQQLLTPTHTQMYTNPPFMAIYARQASSEKQGGWRILPTEGMNTCGNATQATPVTPGAARRCVASIAGEVSFHCQVSLNEGSAFIHLFYRCQGPNHFK